MQLIDASGVDAVETATLKQGPQRHKSSSTHVRAEEGPKELIPHRGLVSESLTNFLDLARVCDVLVVGAGLGAAAIPPDDRRGIL